MTKRPILWHPLLGSVVLALLVWLLLAGVVWSGLLDAAELEGYDLLVFRRGFAPQPTNLLLVDFDEATVAALGCYPIARSTLADVLEKIEAGQPKVVGLDVLLSEKRCGEQDDSKLAAELEKAGNVILVDNFDSQDFVASEPLPEFRERALVVAFANVPVDRDGIIRRMFLARKRGGTEKVSLAAALASYYSDETFRPCGLRTFCLGKNQIPLDSPNSSTYLIGFWSLAPAREVSAEQLLKPGFDPSIFQGKIVVVGQSSTKGKDLYATPLFRFRKPAGSRAFLSGPEIQAAAVATLLAGPTIRVTDHLPQWSLNLLLIWLTVWLVMTLRPVYSVPAVVAVILGVYLLAQSLFSQHQVWIRFASAEVGIVLATPLGLGYRFLEERRLKSLAQAERRQIMGLFERYVSPEVAAEIWNRREEIVLAGQERVATVLFSDIRSFTQITAGKPCHEVLGWLNDYFNAMSEVVRRNGGYLNKFMGDGLMVIFGVPLSESVEKDACRAVQAALQMLDAVEVLNARCTDCRPLLKIGIGLHTGLLTAGNVGARDRLEYSVIGETVNLASRLESLTKEFKTSIVMSPATEELIRSQFETCVLGETLVRGFPEEIRVYTAIRGRASGCCS